jgi:hypothetical protein
VGGVENEAERTAGEGRNGAVPGGSVDAVGSVGTDRSDDIDRSAGATEVDGLDTHSLISRLSAIESRPLEQRAAALAELHDELRARLEGGDAAAARG